jgi:hypothetical protein
MYRLPAAALWILVFAAVLGHFPGLGFDFSGTDFEGLARGAGLEEASRLPLHPWTAVGTWSLWWRVSRSDPSIPHGMSVLLVALIAWLVARIGARVGLTRAGAVLAGTLVLLGAQTGYAVAWTSASAELWALFFALAALGLWMAGNERRDPPLAAVLLGLSLASGDLALVLAPVFWMAWRWFGPTRESGAVRRGRVALLTGVGILAVISWIRLLQVPFDPLSMSTRAGGLDASAPLVLLYQLGSSAWPWPFAPSMSAARILGAVVLVGAVLVVFRTRRQPAPRLRFALLWTAATLAPILLLPGHARNTGALAPAVGLAWAAGALLGPALETGLYRLRSRVQIGDALVLILLLLAVGPGWAMIRSSALGQTDGSGRLVDPVLQSAVITAGVREQITAVMNTEQPPAQVAFLQATRIQLPEGVETPADQELIFASPVYTAIAGGNGPRLMLAGRATVRWTGLLDEVSPDAFVFLDSGDDRIRPLGPVENARIYAALIAIAAGQFDLARHELWSVAGAQGARVRFAFDPDHLPISPRELDAEASSFALWLKREDSPSSLRILRLFASVYESVRGQPLIDEGWGEPLRAGRVDR